ncbi:MAG: hypothetical protein Q8P07_06400 [bacterium]|nr:hypothetical protein [bacterium]
MWLSDDWLIKRNKVPYQGAKEHLLFIPREHITTFEELVPKWNQIPELVAWAKDKYGKGGSLVVRLGTFEETGSTVQHLHLHWIVRQDSPDAPTVYAHFGPKKYKM